MTGSPDICPICRHAVGANRVCVNPACGAVLDKGDWALPEAYGALGLLPPEREGEAYRLGDDKSAESVQGRLVSSLPPRLDPLDGVFHIGAAGDSNIVISGAASPRHVSLHANRRTGQWWAFDWGAAPAATINGERFRNRLLKDDDVISIAGLRLRYRSGRLSLEGGSSGGVTLAARNLTDSRLSRSHPHHPLLDRVSFTVPGGSFVGIIGPSGCGKSTLIKTLAGLVKPASGEMSLNGNTLAGGSAAARECTAYLPQDVDDTLHDELTLEGEIASYSAIHNARRDLARERTLLSELGLSPKSRIGEMSGGQRRRAAFLLALLGDPSVLLLDEPAAGLDRATETGLMEALRQMTKSGAHKTVLAATHELANFRLFDRVLAMSCGQIAYDGPPEGLFEALGIPGEGEERFKALYDRLSETPPSGAIAEGIAKCRKAALEETSARPLPKPPKRASWAGCVAGYLGRFARLFFPFARTPPFKWPFSLPFVLFLWQPLAVALCIACALKGNYTDAPDEQKTVFFCSAIAAFWLGMGSSVRSLVSSRTARAMERLQNVGLGAYFAAVSVSTLIKGLVQGVSLSLFLYLLPSSFAGSVQWSHSLSAVLGITFCLVAVEWVGGFVGLALSACCPTESMAVAIVPNIAIVALFFSQPLMDFRDGAQGLDVAIARHLPAHHAHHAMTDWNNPALSGNRWRDTRDTALAAICYLAMLSLVCVSAQASHEKRWKG